MDRNNNLFCDKHNEEIIQFICLNEQIPEGISRLLCASCLEDANDLKLILVSLNNLRNNNNRIISQWPPLHQKINLNDLKLIDIKKQIESIEIFYNGLIQEIYQLLYEQKKNILMQLSKFQNQDHFFTIYKQASGFSQIKEIIDDNSKSIQAIQKQLDDYIKQKYQQIDQNQKLFDDINQQIQLVKEEELLITKDEILQKISQISIIEKVECIDRNQNIRFLQSLTGESNQITIQNLDKILIKPMKSLTGQVYSEKPLDQDKIYQYIIRFNKKPLDYILIGFQDTENINLRLGNTVSKSFLLGQKSQIYCGKQVKGSQNLNNKCYYDFIEYLIIEVQLKNNKFYVADFPKKESVNCMDSSIQQFLPKTNYHLTIEICTQDTQIEITQRIINNFTLA